MLKIKGVQEGKESFKRELADKLKEEIRVSQKQGYVYIWDVEEDIGEEEVLNSLRKEIGVESREVRITSLEKSFGRTRVTVRMPVDKIEKLARKGSLKIGYMICGVSRVEFKERCFNCGGTGHFAGNCKEHGKRGKCFFCEKEGHLARQCPKKKDRLRSVGGVGIGGAGVK